MPADAAKPEIPDLLAELRWRGLIHQCTDEKALHEHLNPPAGAPGSPGALPPGGRRIYAGFDPTADSLTIGNLVPIMLLRHAQRAGHTPVVVMGGGTGLIGDPSGKSAERELMTEERVAANVESQQRIFARILDFKSEILNPATLVNNLDWWGKATLLAFLRNIGKHFSVNQMMMKDSVRERLQNREQGISFTEFTYQLLQAADFQHLYDSYGVTAQLGGSDQWGNIVAGIDLIQRWAEGTVASAAVDAICARLEQPADWQSRKLRLDAYLLRCPQNGDRVEAIVRTVLSQSSPTMAALRNEEDVFPLIRDAYQRLGWVPFGLTAPLVTKADGGKFGKTETGAVWLTAERTSPYAYYQFWLNADDRDVERFLKIFTLLKQDEVASLMAQHAADPGARHAHRALAQAATTLLHGEAEMRRAEAAAKALFSGEVASLDKATLAEAFASAPTTTHKKSELSAVAVAPVASAPGSEGGAGGGQSASGGTQGSGAPAPGKSLVDLLVETGLAKSKREAREFLQNGSIALNGARVGPDDRLTSDRLLHGEVALLRRGKKQWHVTRWE